MDWKRENSREAFSSGSGDVFDRWAFSDSDVGRRVVINGELTRKLYGGRKDWEKENRRFLRENADREVEIVDFVGWRKDVARVRDGGGRIGYVRKSHLKGFGE